ncbi:MAG TPA: EAL domain-containing protein, partial [Acidimicrobiales bacterium]|nr:EAL domain-containing protein [Acidimicrobiales bacterium]
LHERIAHMAWHDALTGLPNRRLFEDRVNQQLLRARRSGGPVCLFFVDLDRFKVVNDTLGHAAGDELIRQVGRRLVETVRAQDTVARLGGDEFAILLPDLAGADASELARRTLEALERPFVVEQSELQVTGSIGIASSPLHGETYHELVVNADTAMYTSKSSGRNTFRVFEASGAEASSAGTQLEAELEAALEHNELCLAYQPFIDLHTQSVIGVEALVRWQHPKQGLLGPSAFLPLAEHTGLVVPLDSWVVDEACAQIRRWVDAGLPLLRLAVNVTARDLSSDTFVDAVVRALSAADLEPTVLELEVTESVIMADEASTARNVARLRDLGVRFSIDDFGAGSSGLKRIGAFPLSALKIDQSFVQVLGPANESATLVSAILSLAQSLGLEVVAEGVETIHQSRILLQRGCSMAQGFFFSPPLPPAEVAWLLEGSSTTATGLPSDEAPPLAASQPERF